MFTSIEALMTTQYLPENPEDWKDMYFKKETSIEDIQESRKIYEMEGCSNVYR